MARGAFLVGGLEDPEDLVGTRGRLVDLVLHPTFDAGSGGAPAGATATGAGARSSAQAAVWPLRKLFSGQAAHGNAAPIASDNAGPLQAAIVLGGAERSNQV